MPGYRYRGTQFDAGTEAGPTIPAGIQPAPIGPRRANPGAANLKSVQYKDATHCQRGHEWTEANTLRTRDGHRACRQCRTDARNRWKGQPAPEPAPPEPRQPRTECFNGHEFTEANTYTAPDGKRRCRECSRNRTRKLRENRRNGAETPRSANRDKTHCKHGHEFTEQNTWVSPNGGRRHCKKCIAARTRKRRAAARQAADAANNTRTQTKGTP